MNRIDALIKKTKAFPAAAANNNSDSIKLPLLGHKGAELFVKLPENSLLVATKSITVKVQDSEDGSSFADLPPCGAITVTGKTGNGMPDTPTTSYEIDDDGNVWTYWPLPRMFRGYARVNVAVETGGGDLTGLSYEFGIKA